MGVIQELAVIVARIPVIEAHQVDTHAREGFQVVPAVGVAALRKIGLGSPQRCHLLAGDVAAEIDDMGVGRGGVVALAEGLVGRALAWQGEARKGPRIDVQIDPLEALHRSGRLPQELGGVGYLPQGLVKQRVGQGQEKEFQGTAGRGPEQGRVGRVIAKQVIPLRKEVGQGRLVRIAPRRVVHPEHLRAGVAQHQLEFIRPARGIEIGPVGVLDVGHDFLVVLGIVEHVDRDLGEIQGGGGQRAQGVVQHFRFETQAVGCRVISGFGQHHVEPLLSALGAQVELDRRVGIDIPVYPVPHGVHVILKRRVAHGPARPIRVPEGPRVETLQGQPPRGPRGWQAPVSGGVQRGQVPLLRGQHVDARGVG